MGILIDENTKVIVQGITGREGSFHTQLMLDYGTRIVGGVTPGKGGFKVLGLPVFNTVREAVLQTKATASVIFVPASFAPQAIREAIDAKVRLIVAVTEGIPIQEMLRVVAYIRERKIYLIGPNCPGLAVPALGKLGIIPSSILTPGPVGVVSRSGTLTYEIINNLTLCGIGQSTAIGIGGDPILGMRFLDILPLFEEDKNTEVIVLIGEIGGSDEEDASLFIKKMQKPVVGFISGKTAPREKRMGHAGAIISLGLGSAESKEKAFKEAGVRLAESTQEITQIVRDILQSKK